MSVTVYFFNRCCQQCGTGNQFGIAQDELVKYYHPLFPQTMDNILDTISRPALMHCSTCKKETIQHAGDRKPSYKMLSDVESGWLEIYKTIPEFKRQMLLRDL